jgi:hypothetical protein
LLAALGSVLGVALATWIAARVLARALTTGTKVGIAGLDGIAAPLSLLVATGVAAFGIARPSQAETPPLIGLALGVLGIVGGFWLAQRCLDVAWKTAKERARVQGRHVDDALLVGRSLGRVVLIVCAAAVAVRLGATEQLYFVLTALGAALAFAARDPIRNAIAFVSMVTDPPFHVGDRVRLVDLRGGEDVTGEVVALSLTGTTIETDRRSTSSCPTSPWVSSASRTSPRPIGAGSSWRCRWRTISPRRSSGTRATPWRPTCAAARTSRRSARPGCGSRWWIKGCTSRPRPGCGAPPTNGTHSAICSSPSVPGCSVASGRRCRRGA